MLKHTLIDDGRGRNHVYTGTRNTYVLAICGISFEPAEVSITNHDFSILNCPECIEIMRKQKVCKCGGTNFIRIRARCKDMCEIIINDKEIMQGYPPGSELGLNDASGDDIDFTYCGNCGQIQGHFPITIGDLSDTLRDSFQLNAPGKPAGDDWLQKKAIQEANQPTSVRGSNEE